MMCNPNQQPTNKQNPNSGSRPTGSESGKESPWSGLRPDLEKFWLTAQTGLPELARDIMRLKSMWLSLRLQEWGLLPETAQAVNDRDPLAIAFVADWVKEQGFTWSSPTLNTICLLKHDVIVAKATLFKMPNLYEIETPTHCC